MLRVMVSSTFRDLRDERAAVRAVIDELARQGRSVEAVAMEDLGASPSSPAQVSVGMAERADLAVLLLGARYGTVPSDEALSLTNQEYETIHREKVPCLAYVAEPADGGGEASNPRIAEFRRRVQDDVTVKPYADVEALAEQFRRDLEAWLATVVTSGDARTQGLDTPPGPPLARFVNREDELRKLDDALAGGGDSARVGIWGPPGYGKTSLVQRYFEARPERLHDPLWLRVDDLFGRDQQGRPRVGAVRWEKESVLERLLAIAAERPRAVLVFDNVQAAPPLVSWLAGRIGNVPAVVLSWDAEALPPSRLIALPALPLESAEELVADAAAPDQGDADAIRLLCERLENHPLLVDLATRRLRVTRSLTVAELTQELEGAATRLALEGPVQEGRIVQVRAMLLSSYRCLEPVERRALSALAAAPSVGVSESTLRWAIGRFGEGKIRRLDRAVSLGLLEGRTSPDWRGHRFRLRSLIHDFLQTTDAFPADEAAFDEYLAGPESLRDESVEVVPRALERQLAAAAPGLPEGGAWAEQLLAAASAAMRARVHAVLARVADPDQAAELAAVVGAVLATSRPEDVTLELVGALGRWRAPESRRVLLRLWRDPEVDRAGEPLLSREVGAAAGRALAELDGRGYSEFLRATIEAGSRPDREAAIDAAANDEVAELRPVLVGLLDDGSAPTRRAAADGLADFDPDPAASDRLWQLKETDSDAGVRDSAAAALGVWRDERVVDYFLRKLDDADPDVRGQACSVLWRFRSPRVADRLVDVARDDPEPGARGTATFVLADWRDPRAATITLGRLLGPDDYERMVAAGMVARLAGSAEMTAETRTAIADELASWLDGEPIALRLVARAGLAALEDDRCYPGLWGDVAYDASVGQGSYRWFVIRQLAKWVPQAFEPLRLRPLLHDRDPDMRSSAALVAGQVRALELVPDLEALLDDPAVGHLGSVAKEAREALDRVAGRRPPWEPVRESAL